MANNRDMTITLRVNAQTGQLETVRDGLDDVDSSAGRASNSLATMGTRLLALAGATFGIYAIVNALKDLAVESWESNVGLDLASSKLLSLVSAGKAYVDTNGNMVSSVQRTNAVQIESAKILQMIRDVNSETALGITDLVQVYALAKPNMDRYNWALKDQIEIVKLVSNTASNFSMGANELSTGIDDLATGTWLANSAFGKMMKTMGISKAEYKLVGDKVSFLKEKLKETGQASDNYATALSNMAVEWDNVVSGMSATSFENAKGGLKALTEQLKDSETVMASSIINYITEDWSQSFYDFQGSALSVATTIINAIPELAYMFEDLGSVIDLVFTLSTEYIVDFATVIDTTFGDLIGSTQDTSSELGFLENIIRILSASAVSAGAYIDNLGVYFQMAGVWASNFGESIKININVMLAKMMVKVAEAKVAVASMMDFVGLSSDIAIAQANLIKAQTTVSTLEKSGDAIIAKNKANLASYSKSIKSSSDIVVMMDKAMIKSSADLQKKRDSYSVKKKADAVSDIELANKVNTNATKVAKKANTRRATATKDVKKNVDEREKAYLTYLKAVGREEEAQTIELQNKLKDLGSKGLSKSQLSEIYEAELRKMQGFTDDFSKDFKKSFESLIDGDINKAFGSLFDSVTNDMMNPMLESMSKSASGVLNDIVGDMGITSSFLVGGALSVGASLIKGLLSSSTTDAFSQITARGESDNKSLENSINILADIDKSQLEYTKKMSTSLDLMNTNFDRLGITLAKSQGIDYTGSQYVGSTSANLWGGKSTSLEGAGLQFDTTNFKDALTDMEIQSYQTVKTVSSSWFGLSKSTNISTAFTNAGTDLTNSFMDSIGYGIDTIESAMSGLSLDSSVLDDALQNTQFDIGKISLEGKSSDEISSFLSSLLGEQLDKLSANVFTSLDEFNQVGEGYLETGIRVASGVEVAQKSLEKLKISMVDYGDIIDKQGDVYTELIRDSIVKSEIKLEDLIIPQTDYMARYAIKNIYQATEIGKIIKSSAELGDELLNLYTDLTSLQSTLRGFGDTAIEVSQDMIDGAGSLEALQQGADTYFNSFLTIEEQIKAKSDELKNIFDIDIGTELPNSKEEFVKLLNSIDNTSQKYGKLLSLSGDFLELDEMRSTILDETKAKEQELIDTQTALNEARDNELLTLQDRYNMLLTTTDEEKLQIERDRERITILGDEAKTLLETIYIEEDRQKALQDSIELEKSIADEKKSLNDKLFELTATEEQKREAEISSLYDVNKTLQESIYIEEDRQKALQESIELEKNIADEKKSLNDKLFELTATEEQKREAQISSLYDVNKILQESIYIEEDRQKALEESLQAQKDYITNSKKETDETLSIWDSVSSSLVDSIEKLRNAGKDGATSIAEFRESLRLSESLQNGDVSTYQNSLSRTLELSSSLLERENFDTSRDQLFAQLTTAKRLEELQSNADVQVDELTLVSNTLESQLAYLEDTKNYQANMLENSNKMLGLPLPIVPLPLPIQQSIAPSINNTQKRPTDTKIEALLIEIRDLLKDGNITREEIEIKLKKRIA